MTNILDSDVYLARVKPYIDKDLIKVFTGQRRVGKSKTGSGLLLTYIKKAGTPPLLKHLILFLGFEG